MLFKKYSFLPGWLIFPFVLFGQDSTHSDSVAYNTFKKEVLGYALSSINHDKPAAYYDKKAIPPFIKKWLDSLESGFTIANPKEEYACCCTSSGKLPRHQLLMIARSPKMMIMVYRTGGVGVWTTVLYAQFTGQKIDYSWAADMFEEPRSLAALMKSLKNYKAVLVIKRPGT